MGRGFQSAMMKAFGATDHVMTVVWAKDITPGFRRVRVHAPTMIDGRETPTASWIRLWAPDPDIPGKVHQRGYTLIDPDPATGQVSFDFVMHQPAGPAASWAAAAKPGDSIVASYFSYTKFEPVEPEPEGYLLLGEPASVPAINDILAVLPPETEIVVLLEALQPGDETIPVASHPGATVRWVSGKGSLVAAVPERDWSNWHAWVAGESATVKAVRASLNQRHGFPLADITHRAYWLRGKAMRLRKDRTDHDDHAETPPTQETPAPPPIVAEAPPTGRRWRSQGGADLLASVRWKLRVGGVIQGLVTLTQLAPFVLLAEIGRLLLAGTASAETLRPLVIAAIGLFGLAAGLATILMVWLHAVDARFGYDLRRAMIAKLARLPLGWFTDRNAAAVRQAVQEDAGRLHYTVTHAVPDTVAGSVAPLAALIYLFTVNAGLAGLLLLPLVAFVVFFSLMMRGNGDNLAKVADWTKKANAAAGAFVEALPVVRVFGGDGRALHQVLDGQARFLNGWQRPMAGRKVLSQLSIQPPTFLLVVLAGGLWRISSGGMAPADLLPFLFLGTAFGGQIMAIMYGFVPLREGRAAARRIGILMEEPELDLTRATGDLPPGPVGLRFRDVSFGYRPRRPVLQGVTLDLPAGSFTALVGPSGAGKTTLATLPARFHDVTGGAILLTAAGREVDIRTLRPDVLQRTVGFVFQDVRLIRGTVAENIALSRPGASRGTIEEAARKAQIHDRIQALPRGYDSMIGEDALLSGGEAQRLSIARALIADPPVLILDEATAFADPESEHLVQQALTALTDRRTVLVVAHRLHTVTHADRIVVIQAGRVAQQGRHEALLAAPGLYRDLWNAGGKDQA